MLGVATRVAARTAARVDSPATSLHEPNLTAHTIGFARYRTMQKK